MRAFDALSERELLALAISLEEDDARIYGDFADGLQEQYPEQAEKFTAMRSEEDVHRHRLIEVYRERFGEHIPLIRRHDVKGFVNRRPVWLVRPLGLAVAQRHAAVMEQETRQFYEAASRRTTDAGTRQLLGDLIEAERKHTQIADSMRDAPITAKDADTKQRMFVMQVVQPGLAGLMDGSVSTLAPLFAAAFATQNSWDTFRVGLAASLGAGISMGFAEALSDDGAITGRGHPLIRGVVCGMMTTIGGLGHTLPYLIPSVRTATTVAIGIVAIELLIIAWIRHRYMDTPLLPTAIQVIIGGILVFLTGLFIGTS